MELFFKRILYLKCLCTRQVTLMTGDESSIDVHDDVNHADVTNMYKELLD